MEFLRFKLFENLDGIQHFVSTCNGGVSKGAYSSLNLSFNAGDETVNVIQNRDLLAERIGVSKDKIYFPEQCHTANIKVIEPDQNPSLEETDGLITRQKGVAICILAADCVPVLLYDKGEGIIAALHAGWKGTIQQIVTKAIALMSQKFGSEPANILAGIGPAISQANYEVGEEVTAQFRSLFADETGIIWENPNNTKSHINLQLANTILLRRAGVKSEHIEMMEKCTYSNPKILFSARRDGFESGRFGTGIMLVNL